MRGGGEAGRRGDGADLSLFDEKPRILDLGIPLHSRFGGTHANPACTLTPAEGYVWWCGPGSQHEGFLACPHPQNHANEQSCVGYRPRKASLGAWRSVCLERSFARGPNGVQ